MKKLDIKKLLVAVAITTATNISFAQTPYDSFAPSSEEKEMLKLDKYTYTLYNIDTFNIKDTLEYVSYLEFDIEAYTLNFYNKQDSLFKTVYLNPMNVKWLSVDPLAEKYPSSSPYNFVDNNPITKIDPDGRNWFYYQAEGSEEKTWNWHEGNKATYTDVKGKQQTIKSNYEYLATYTITGKNAYGAATGYLELYNQNDKVLKESYVFSGGGWWTSDGIFNDEEPKDYNPIQKGLYTMNMGKRDDGVLIKNGSSQGPNRFEGIQYIPKNTVNSGGYDVSSNYGGGRIFLKPMENQPDRSLYLHGKEQWYNRRTHGCVCDKDEAIFNYFWSGDGNEYRGIVPFQVIEK